MEENSATRKLLWESMLSADLSHRYFVELASKYRRWDRLAKVFLAATSSATVAAWALWKNPGLEWAWKSASGVAALVGVALPIFDPANTVRTASQLGGTWFAILKDYELLWAECDELTDAQCREKVQQVVKEEKRLVELEATIRRDKTIARKCEREVRSSRGLQ